MFISAFCAYKNMTSISPETNLGSLKTFSPLALFEMNEAQR